MNKFKIAYWTTTVLFAGFMTFSAIPGITLNPESVQFIVEHLGYPEYFLQFISVAKLLGSIAIVIPGLYRIKEWAYAGLAFDLIGASWSIYMVDGFEPSSLMMIPILAVMCTSYYLHHKLYAPA